MPANMPFHHTLAPVKNRGMAPIGFLNSLLEFLKTAPDEIFAPRKDDKGEMDVYTSVKDRLGPWISLPYRKAAMGEILRVLAAFESSWRPNTGADSTNPAENNDETYSAGLWQISYNSRAFGKDLRDMLYKREIHSGKEFQEWMKRDFNFAAEYTTRLLRHTIRHNGPVRDHHIDQWLSRNSAQELLVMITTPPL